jgi:hypothetical protein
MKLNETVTPVRISGAVSAPSTFNITASKEAFKILSSGIYTNKIRAVIRELACNAYDAHVAAQKPREPFELHLPTFEEAFFSVRDNGTGLQFKAGGCEVCGGRGALVGQDGEASCAECEGTGDYDAVKELYCNYFSSNKTDSNLFIGALGLGSKSPFSYTEGFSVQNRFDGVTRVYACFIDGHGLPSVLLQSVMETPDAVNGVEVSFPVNQDDVEEFENQAAEVLEFFDPLPTINIGIEVNRPEYTFRTERWGLRSDGEGPRAIQGMVQYDLGDIDESRLTTAQRSLLRCSLDLFFPIGQLRVAASREALSNDETTIPNVLAALDEVQRSFAEKMEADLAVHKTVWDRRVRVAEMARDGELKPMLCRALAQKQLVLDWLGGGPTDAIVVSQEGYLKLQVFEFSRRGDVGVRKARISILPTLNEAGERVFTAERLTASPMRFEAVTTETMFVVNDVGHGVDRYVNNLVQRSESKVRHAYLLTWLNRQTPVALVIEQANRLLEALGNPPVVLVSELRALHQSEAKANREEPPRLSRKLFKLNLNRRIRGDNLGWLAGWDEVDHVNVPDGVKYYVSIKNREPERGFFHNIHALRKFVSLARAVLDPTLTNVVYGVPYYRVKELDATWVELTQHVADELERAWTPKLAATVAVPNVQHIGLEGVFREVVHRNELPRSSPFRRFCESWLAVSKVKFNTDLSRLRSWAERMGKVLPVEEITITTEWNETEDLYPLLTYLKSSHVGQDKVVAYVRLVDEQRAREAELAQLSIINMAASTEEGSYAN